MRGIFEAPNACAEGSIWIETNSCGSPQLETLSSEIATTIRAAMLNHFRFIVTPGTERST
jgi:hypothetical protein